MERLFNQKVLVVGVDIGRERHTAVGITPDGSKYGPFDFSNKGDGFRRLLEEVMKWKCESGMERVVFGIEPSGHYWLTLAHFLKENRYEFFTVHPFAQKRMRDIEDNSPLKSDKKDAYIIADLVMQGKCIRGVIPEGIYAELSKLMIFRRKLIREMVSLKNFITSSVELIFPEIFSVFKSLWTKTAIYFLKNYLPLEKVKKIDPQTLYFEFRRVSRGKIGVEVVERLKSLVETSVGLKDGVEIRVEELKFYIRRLEEVMEAINEVEKRIKSIVKMVDEAEFLLRMKWVGYLTVAAFLGFTNGLRDFHSSDEVLKFMGLNLVFKQSGKRKSKPHISKRGNSTLRKAMFLAGLRQTRKNAPLYEYYLKLKKKGKPRMVILIALTRKLVRVLFGMVKSRTDFNPDCISEAA
jgi:transposase